MINLLKKLEDVVLYPRDHCILMEEADRLFLTTELGVNRFIIVDEQFTPAFKEDQVAGFEPRSCRVSRS